MSNEFLNFAEISHAVLFRDLLDSLNIAYTVKNGELKGDGFIVNVSKNLFFMPQNSTVKGSPINFLAHHKGIELREAASLLKQQFLSKTKDKKLKRDMPNLTLEWDEYIKQRGITLEVAKEYEIGLVKQRSIVAGRIAFKVYDYARKVVGYIGYKLEDNSWYYPKGFKRPLYNANRVKDTKSIVVTVDPFDALRIVSQGITQVTSLLANSMTSEQEEQLTKFKYILLLHPEPLNIVNRLYQTSFIKAPVLSKPLMEMTDIDLIHLIKPT